MTAVTKIEISTFDISETSGPILAKLYYKGPWLVLFKNCTQWVHPPLSIAAVTKNSNIYFQHIH
jgi:hypothetical protein